MPSSNSSDSLVSVIRELSLAWQKLSLYQEGHPLREQGAERAHAVLAHHLARHGALPLGVSRTALIGPDDKLTGEAAAKLAAALHQRSVTWIRFDLGITPAEIRSFLELLPSRSQLGENTPWTETLPHVHVELIDFSELVDEAIASNPTQRTSLWDRVLERILQQDRDARADLTTPSDAGDIEGDRGGDRTLQEVTDAISALLDRYRQAETSTNPASGDEGVPTYVLAFLGNGLREAVEAHLSGPRLQAQETQNQGNTDLSVDPRLSEIAQLLSAVPAALQGSILDAALREFCSAPADPSAVLLLAEAAAPSELVDALRRLRAEGLTLTPASLLAIEPQIARGVTPAPDTILERLPDADDIDQLQPPEGNDRRLVVRLPNQPKETACSEPADAMGAVDFDSLSPHRQSIAVATSLLELVQRSLLDDEQAEAIAWRLEELFLTLLSGGSVRSALRILRSLHHLATTAATPSRQRTLQKLIERLGHRRTVQSVVDAVTVAPTSQEAAQQVIDLLGPDFLRELLGALGEEKDRSRRRRIFDLLATLGPRLTPYLRELLHDPRWYVVRNVFTLLQRSGTVLSPELVDWGLRHPEARVRLEASKCLAPLGGAVTVAVIERALADPEPKIAEAAVQAVGAGGIHAGLEPLLALLAQSDRLGRRRELRVKALQALGQLGDPSALPALRSFFRGRFAGVAVEERRAAFASLENYPPAARQPYVKAGLRSPDGEVRAVCARLRESDAAKAPVQRGRP